MAKKIYFKPIYFLQHTLQCKLIIPSSVFVQSKANWLRVVEWYCIFLLIFSSMPKMSN